jgi:heme/copper-type cytochrome/quinol oxidase subunit 2
MHDVKVSEATGTRKNTLSRIVNISPGCGCVTFLGFVLVPVLLALSTVNVVQEYATEGVFWLYFAAYYAVVYPVFGLIAVALVACAVLSLRKPGRHQERPK